MLVEERPWRNNRQESESRPSQANVESLLDILTDNADEECNDARQGEKGVCDEFSETLSFEVLGNGGQVLVQSDNGKKAWGCARSRLHRALVLVPKSRPFGR